MHSTTEANLSKIVAPLTYHKTQSSLSLVGHAAEIASFEAQIDSIVNDISPLPLQQTVRRVFDDLIRLLDCLRMIGTSLHQVGETLALFELIDLEARALVEFTKTQALRVEHVNERLYDVLDGLAYAIGHDVRRVFECELQTLSADEPGHLVVGKISHAHGILTNCLQQSIITLAQVFDPRLDGQRLFNDSKMRCKQSLILCRDLWTIIKLMRRAGDKPDRNVLESIVAEVKAFLNGTMQYLMYKDWEQFETFAHQLISATGEQADVSPLLHQFLCYLETLLGEVKMRAVVSDVLADFFCAQLDGQGSELGWIHDDLRLAFELYMAS